jgi:antitoxin component of RelBE/YafQ-DinJ toxin-antitoxin module
MVEPKKKTRGRPPSGGRDPLIGLRLSPELTARVDAWAEHQKLTRSEAIRQMIEQALATVAIPIRAKRK